METLREIIGFLCDWMLNIILASAMLVIVWLFSAELLRTLA